MNKVTLDINEDLLKDIILQWYFEDTAFNPADYEAFWYIDKNHDHMFHIENYDASTNPLKLQTDSSLG